MGDLMKFCVAINCMDGRVQLPVISYLKKRFKVDYVDSITEPGPNLILAEQKNTEAIQSIISRANISVKKHKAVGMAVVGHHDCAGNPMSKEDQIIHLESSLTFLRKNFNLPIIALWVDKNWDVQEICMKKITPKIICVGFQKTGTTSLKHALELLGYSVTGTKPKLLLPILRNNWNKVLKVLNKYDAAEDNPWNIIYRQIDRMVPGCKFILTYRDPESWFRSVKRYFRLPRSSPPLHEWIYGRGKGLISAEKENTISIYKQHIQGVREYFRNRPHDLLEIDLTKGDKWDPLCDFLGCDIPDMPFPHRRDSKKKKKKKRNKVHKRYRKIKKYLHYGALLRYIDMMGYPDFRREPGTLPAVDTDSWTQE